MVSVYMTSIVHVYKYVYLYICRILYGVLFVSSFGLCIDT